MAKTFSITTETVKNTGAKADVAVKIGSTTVFVGSSELAGKTSAALDLAHEEVLNQFAEALAKTLKHVMGDGKKT